MLKWKVGVFVLCFLGFFLTFYRFGRLKYLRELYQRTRWGVEEATRRRLHTARMHLTDLEESRGILVYLEKQLWYSGWKRQFPWLGAEGFALLLLLGGVLLFLSATIFWGLLWGCLLTIGFVGAVFGALTVGKGLQMRAINENLMKFLDFLGNYSATPGDVICHFEQIARYMEEPLKSLLEQCCAEAQMTGDVGMALLSMADKVQHPQFRELVRNIEISSRYSADFCILVTFSRRSMREYARSGSERKSLLREAGINLLLLLGMSLFALVTVNGLLEVSIWSVLVHTIPGRIAIGVVGVILFLFLGQIYKLEG